MLDNETSTEFDKDEEDVEDEEEFSYLDDSFKGSNLVMDILFMTLTLILFVVLILLVILCRRIIMQR